MNTVQFALKVDFYLWFIKLCGVWKCKFSTPKKFWLEAKPPLWHARFFVVCVSTQEKSDSGVNVKLKKKLTLLEDYECLG